MKENVLRGFAKQSRFSLVTLGWLCCLYLASHLVFNFIFETVCHMFGRYNSMVLLYSIAINTCMILYLAKRHRASKSYDGKLFDPAAGDKLDLKKEISKVILSNSLSCTIAYMIFTLPHFILYSVTGGYPFEEALFFDRFYIPTLFWLDLTPVPALGWLLGGLYFLIVFSAVLLIGRFRMFKKHSENRN